MLLLFMMRRFKALVVHPDQGSGQPLFFGIVKQGAIALQAEPQHGAFFLGADGLDAAMQVLGHLGDGHATGQ